MQTTTILRDNDGSWRLYCLDQDVTAQWMECVDTELYMTDMFDICFRFFVFLLDGYVEYRKNSFISILSLTVIYLNNTVTLQQYCSADR